MTNFWGTDEEPIDTFDNILTVFLMEDLTLKNSNVTFKAKRVSNSGFMEVGAKLLLFCLLSCVVSKKEVLSMIR